jgi:hypothetical protein
MKKDDVLFWLSIVWFFGLCAMVAWMLSSPVTAW